VVGEIRIDIERARHDAAHHVFDELWVVMRFIDDEEFVGSLEEIVRLARHRIFHDLDEIFGSNFEIAIVARADEDRTEAALIMRRDRQRIERAIRVGLGKSGLDEFP